MNGKRRGSRKLVFRLPRRSDRSAHEVQECVDILTADRLRRVTKHTLAVVPVHRPTARLRCSREGLAIHDGVGDGLRAIAALGLVGIPQNYVVLKRLVAIVETVRAGDPFVAANAYRLQAIAWALLALQLLSLVIGAIAKAVSTPAHPLHLDAGFSINGWLAVLLTFVLARVFAEGTLMRDDLEGTV